MRLYGKVVYAIRAAGFQTIRRPMMVLIVRRGRSRVLSFPRKRESTSRAIGNATTGWIPAFAGMTRQLMGFEWDPIPNDFLQEGS